jgi:soluble lytic murein transglycosylase-like protein
MNQPNAGRFAPLIEQYAKLQQLDPALVKAVIAVESSFQPNAVSVKGAVGLMQIIPETGERYGVLGDATRSIEQKLRDPAINLRVGTRHLRYLLVLFADDLELALAAYNAGENAVARYDNTIPPFAETLEYVKLVQQFHSFYRPLPPLPPKQVRIVVREGARQSCCPVTLRNKRRMSGRDYVFLGRIVHMGICLASSHRCRQDTLATPSD